MHGLRANKRAIRLTVALSLWLCPLTGCIGCADGRSVYEVQGTLIDADGGEPVSDASIDISLDGVRMCANVPVSTDGEFACQFVTNMWGTTGLVLAPDVVIPIFATAVPPPVYGRIELTVHRGEQEASVARDLSAEEQRLVEDYWRRLVLDAVEVDWAL